MRVIQIRGSNGSGKTTAARQCIESRNLQESHIDVKGAQYKVYTDGETAVLGKYKEGIACGGLDGYIKDKEELKNLIARIIKSKDYETLIFEGVMYGRTFKFSHEIYKLTKALGAEYIALCLVPDFETAIERIYARNGGKPVNIEGLERSYRQAIKSNAKLRAAGVKTITVDTSAVPVKEMGSVLEELL